MEVLAVEGSYASVIGGAPAAAVVFTREVDKRTAADPRVRDLEATLGSRGRRRAGPAAGGAGHGAGVGPLGEARRGGGRVRGGPRHRARPPGGLGARHHPGGRAAPAAHRRRRAGHGADRPGGG